MLSLKSTDHLNHLELKEDCFVFVFFHEDTKHSALKKEEAEQTFI